MDQEFALAHRIILQKISHPISVSVIGGRCIASRDIIGESKSIRVVLGSLACNISFNIIASPEHPIILGLPWFELHNPEIDWESKLSRNSHETTCPMLCRDCTVVHDSIESNRFVIVMSSVCV
jgi:hypothetical protein